MEPPRPQDPDRLARSPDSRVRGLLHLAVSAMHRANTLGMKANKALDLAERRRHEESVKFQHGLAHSAVAGGIALDAAIPMVAFRVFAAYVLANLPAKEATILGVQVRAFVNNREPGDPAQCPACAAAMDVGVDPACLVCEGTGIANDRVRELWYAIATASGDAS